AAPTRRARPRARPRDPHRAPAQPEPGAGLKRHPISSNRRFPADSLIGEKSSLFDRKFSLFDRLGKWAENGGFRRARGDRTGDLARIRTISLIFSPLTGIRRAICWLDEPGWISLWYSCQALPRSGSGTSSMRLLPAVSAS